MLWDNKTNIWDNIFMNEAIKITIWEYVFKNEPIKSYGRGLLKFFYPYFQVAWQ